MTVKASDAFDKWTRQVLRKASGAELDAVRKSKSILMPEMAEALEKLGADVDLSKVTELGKDVAMNTAGFYLQSHLQVEDYYVVNVGLVKYNGMHIPVTLGILGSVHRLVDEEQVSRLLRDHVKR